MGNGNERMCEVGKTIGEVGKTISKVGPIAMTTNMHDDHQN